MKTYKMVETDEAPIMGEIRVAVTLFPISLSQMFPVHYFVIWTGTEWVYYGPTESDVKAA